MAQDHQGSQTRQSFLPAPGTPTKAAASLLAHLSCLSTCSCRPVQQHSQAVTLAEAKNCIKNHPLDNQAAWTPKQQHALKAIARGTLCTCAWSACSCMISFCCSSDCRGSTHTTTRGISKLDFSAAPGPKLTGPTDASGPKPTSPDGATHLTLPRPTCS